MLGMPESAIGFIPDVGSSYILSRMEDSVGLYLGLTGYVLNHFETYKLKLGNYFIYHYPNFLKSNPFTINGFKRN